MRESFPVCVTGRLVALALAGSVILAGPLAAAPAAVATFPTSIAGRAAVVDGDTLDIGSQRIRLEGIDAPEHGQTCGHELFGRWPCGRAATRKLEALVGNRHVQCDSAGRDKYGRMLGLCFVEGRDINREMVRSGLAWAFVKYSNRYVAEERDARIAKAGVWQGQSEPAWVYREREWSKAGPHAPANCAIKGNISENGRIYHMPWSPWYGKVRIEPVKGERWFCSETDALDAGFRPAK